MAVLLTVVLLWPAGLQAQDNLGYDRYAPVYDEPLKPMSFWKKALLHWPVYPFELIRWPVSGTLNFIEDYHIDKKIRWTYDQLKNRGISPYLNIVNISEIGAGAKLDIIRLAGLRYRFPDTVLNGWIRRSGFDVFETGAEVGLERIGGTGLAARSMFDYEWRGLEHFYGIGPNTSKGDGYVYGTETTTIRTELEYEWSPMVSGKTFLAYQNVNINGGKDGGRGQIGEGVFSETCVLGGLDGDSFLIMGFEAEHDTRNQNENSTSGGLRRFAFSYHEGLNSSDARFFRYVADVRHYLALGSTRRVLAFRFYGQHNDEINGGTIPFHQMPMLGGYGVAPHLSHTLRGFDNNRFRDESALLFNVEYRYTIWEYRYYKLDTVVFWDQGQVFSEFSEFQLKDFRESYGLGFRLSAANIPLLSVEMAHSDEGTNVYVKSRLPF